MFEKRPHRLRDLLLYVLITFSVLALIYVFATNGWGMGWGRWVLLSLFTLFILYFWIKESRPLWRRKSFWTISVLLFTLHSAWWITTMRHSLNSQPTWLTSLIELSVFLAIARSMQPQSKD